MNVFKRRGSSVQLLLVKYYDIQQYLIEALTSEDGVSVVSVPSDIRSHRDVSLKKRILWLDTLTWSLCLASQRAFEASKASKRMFAENEYDKSLYTGAFSLRISRK
jgi:hypothetical protein